ncbi:MAG TPA: hypothetical protein DCW31_10830 [Lactobacillus sp.]|nr:hypothetical protein [Lactobacillus sp.]
MKKFNRFLNSTLFYRLSALVLAIFLVVYVTSSTGNDTRLARQSNPSRVSSLTSTKTKTVSMPLQLNINSNKYFVTGYPERVKVKITGPAALVTATTNTQNFSINADLTGLSMGKHKVTLKADGLNKELTYQIVPKTINVTIARRETITMPVHVKYDANSLASGYQVGTPTTSVNSVTVTGATAEVEEVAQVVAPINLTKNSTSSLSATVQLEAQDANGHTVNVVMTPATATVRVPITSNESSKKVKVSYEPKNAEDGRSYEITGDVTSLTAYGTKSAISKLKDSVVASVDVSGLGVGTTKQQVNLTPSTSGIKSYSETTANVTIKVSATNSDTDGVQHGGSSVSSSSDTTSSSSEANESSGSTDSSSSSASSSASSSSSDTGNS